MTGGAVRGCIAVFNQPRLPGLERRVPLYAAAGLLAGATALALPRSAAPNAWLAAGVSIAATLAFVLQVGSDTSRFIRGRITFNEPVLVVCAFLLPWPWAVTCWAVGAVVSGVYIRIYRTTPGRMAVGASTVTLGAAAAFLSPRPQSSGAVALVATALYLFWVAHVVRNFVFSTLFGSPGTTPLRRVQNWLVPSARALFNYGCGATLGVAGVLLADLEPWLLLLVAMPYISLLAGGAASTRVRVEKGRMEALVELGNELHRASSEEEVLAIICGAVREMQGCGRARVQAVAPGRGEAGARVPGLDGQTWIVAERRYGPPSYQGRYRRDEHRLMEVIAAVAGSAIENVQLVQHHYRLSRTDRLTGMPNRLAVEEHLESAVATARRSGGSLGVLFVDFDHFKSVNERFGHDGGDVALIEAGRRLTSVARGGDFVGRWGGEEFIAVVVGPSGGIDTVRAADRFRRALSAEPVQIGCESLTITASVGGAMLDVHADTAEALIGAADEAVRAAKAAGRDRTCMVDRSVLEVEA